MLSRFQWWITDKDTLSVELLPFGVEVGRDEDDDLTLTIIRRWHGWENLNLRAAMGDGEGPLYYQRRSFGPVGLTRLPLGRAR